MTTATATATKPPPTTVRNLDGSIPTVEPPPLRVEPPATNGTALVTVPNTRQLVPSDDRPRTLAAALTLAQQRCRMAMADKVSDKGAYPSAEEVLAVTREALQGTGLAIFLDGSKIVGEVISTRPDQAKPPIEWVPVEFRFRLIHESGQELKPDNGVVWPAQFAKGCSIHDAFGTALTYATNAFQRSLLLMQRDRKKAPPADGGTDAKEKRRQEAEAKRAATATGATAPVTSPTPPAAATPVVPMPAAQPTATPAAPVSATNGQGSGGIQMTTLTDLASLKAELFGLLGFGADQERMRTEWKAILAKRGVQTANDLTDEQGRQLANGIRHRIATVRKETQETGTTFP